MKLACALPVSTARSSTARAAPISPWLRSALARATNDWLAAEWLDSDNRLLGSMLVSANDPKSAAAEVRRIAADELFFTLKLISDRGPVHRGRRRLAYAVIMEVGRNADDLPPIVGIADADLFTNGVERRLPVLSREILGNDGHRDLFVNLIPREVAPCHQRRSHSGKEAR